MISMVGKANLSSSTLSEYSQNAPGDVLAIYAYVRQTDNRLMNIQMDCNFVDETL